MRTAEDRAAALVCLCAQKAWGGCGVLFSMQRFQHIPQELGDSLGSIVLDVTHLFLFLSNHDLTSLCHLYIHRSFCS